MNEHFGFHARRLLSAKKASLAGAACVALVAVGSSASAASASIARAQPSVVKHSGDVDVLSAGSLDTLMTKTVGPAFHAATGYTLVDTSGGSSTLAADIKNKIDVADVFVSASPAVDDTLRGPKNGDWVSWYADFATSPEVLGTTPRARSPPTCGPCRGTR
jgi:molybdate/tungstate transport system substrate-binding protein